MTERHNIKLSKCLSWLLRHHLDLIYPYLDGDDIEIAKTTGFVECEALLKHPRLQNYNLDEIKQVCAKNDKQRFCIRQHPNNPNKLQIRANQGHSIETVEVELRKITDPNEMTHEVIHGTYKKCWTEIIRSGGLNKMKRNHIHFAKGLPGDSGVISGMQQNAGVRIYIDVLEAMKEGFEFYESSNGVILCPGDTNGMLPTKFFKKVTPPKLWDEYKAKQFK